VKNASKMKIAMPSWLNNATQAYPVLLFALTLHA
jgi:hypothetical protein